MCVFLYLYIHVFGHCTFTCFDLYLDFDYARCHA